MKKDIHEKAKSLRWKLIAKWKITIHYLIHAQSRRTMDSKEYESKNPKIQMKWIKKEFPKKIKKEYK